MLRNFCGSTTHESASGAATRTNAELNAAAHAGGRRRGSTRIAIVPFGLYQMAANDPNPVAQLAAAGFLVAPFAAALTAELPTPSRATFLVLFAAVASAYGVRYLASCVQRWQASSGA